MMITARKPILVLAWLGVLSMLSACAVQHSRLSADPASHAIGRFAEHSSTLIAPVPARWWQLYEDDVLNQLVQQSLSANADLRVAYANLDGARGALSAAQGARLPQTTIESSLGVDFPASQPSAASVASSDYDIAATASWDVDLFGRLRAASRAARHDAAAQLAALDGARVAVAAQTTQAYIDFCGANAGVEVAHTIVDAQRSSVNVVQRQLDVGEVSPLELAQARNLLASAQATLPPYQAARANALYRLAVLQGISPEQARGWHLQCKNLPVLAADVPVADGQALLLRRPDIREAERRLAAATDRIDVARADLYPKVSLGGALGLLTGGYVSTVTPLVTWNFPNQTVTRARIAQAKAGARGALAQWDATVLRALQEVETALSDYQAQTMQLATLDVALEQARLYAARAQARVRIGDTGFLIQYDAERVLASTALQQLQSRLAVARAQVTLFRSLGGGWQGAPAPVALAAPTR